MQSFLRSGDVFYTRTFECAYFSWSIHVYSSVHYLSLFKSDRRLTIELKSERRDIGLGDYKLDFVLLNQSLGEDNLIRTLNFREMNRFIGFKNFISYSKIVKKGFDFKDTIHFQISMINNFSPTKFSAAFLMLRDELKSKNKDEIKKKDKKLLK